MFKESTETSLIGRDLRIIKKDLKGIDTTGAIVAGKVFCSYGQQTDSPTIDTVNSGIILDAAVRENGNTGYVNEIILREWLTQAGGSLQKPALDILIFRDLTTTQQSNNNLVLGTDNLNLITVLSIAENEWKDIDALNAIVEKKFGLDIEGNDTTVLLKALVVMRSTTKTVTVNHRYRLEIRIVRD